MATVPIPHRSGRALRVGAGLLVTVFVVAALRDAVEQRNRPPAPARVIVAGAAFPVSPVVLGNGSIRYAERETGQIREVDASGHLRSEPYATVAVTATPGQRGLLGVAVDRRGRTFAAWTRLADDRLVVGEVTPTAQRIVWLGPPSARLANGGHIVVAPDGRIVIGIGDLLDRRKLTDPKAPNGKILAVDPDGEESQTPTVLSSGWNNPFALAYLTDGSLWVADNAPGTQPERIGRGDTDDVPRTNLPGRRAPSALVALGPDRLGLCGYIDRTMHDVRIVAGRAAQPGSALVAPCSLGAAARPDGSVVVTTEDQLATASP